MFIADKGLSIKDFAVRGEGVVQCGHITNKGEGVLQMRTSTLFGEKRNFGLVEIYGVSVYGHGGGEGVEPVRTFRGQEEGVNFS